MTSQSTIPETQESSSSSTDSSSYPFHFAAGTLEIIKSLIYNY